MPQENSEPEEMRMLLRKIDDLFDCKPAAPGDRKNPT